MSPQQNLVTYLTEKSIDSQFIIQSLDDFAEKITKVTVIILDNAPWHNSKYVQAKIEQWEERVGPPMRAFFTLPAHLFSTSKQN